MSPTTRKKKTSAVTAPTARKLAPRVIKSVEVKPEKIVARPSPSLNLYRRIVGGFIAVVILVLGAILLLSTTQAVVKVTPLVKTTEASFLVEVVDEGATTGEINGLVVGQTFEQSQEYSVTSGEQKEVLEKAGGEVTIFNYSSRNQPLVATTRLLSSGGVLFRLDDGVMVPAGGSVVAMVHADQVGATGDIGPDKFTIPGLSTSLQSSIYAESTVAMAGGKKMVSIVTQEEIDADKEKLTNNIFETAKQQLQETNQGKWSGQVFSFEVLENKCDTQAGEEKDKITIYQRVIVTAVFFDQTALNNLIETKIFTELEEGFVFLTSQNKTTSTETSLEISKTDLNKKTAELQAVVSRNAIVSNTSSFLQPEVLAGKTAAEVEDYLVTAGLASKVTVSFFPPWITRIPQMLDRITVQVVQ